MKNSLSLPGANVMRPAFLLGGALAARLSHVLLLMAGVLAAFLLYSFVINPSLRVLGAASICAAALLPCYMWCRGSASGIPIFPLFALTFVLKYAYPLTTDDPIITIYDDVAGLEAGLLVSAFLLIGTVSWYAGQKLTPRARGPIRAMAPGRGHGFFTTLIFFTALFSIGSTGHWLPIPDSIYPILRAALSGLSSVGIFLAAYRWGAGELDGPKKALFGASFILYLVACSMTLFMVEMIVGTGFAAVAYVVGGGRPPLKLLLVMIGIFTILHAGKNDMRNEYWWDDYKSVQIYEYPWFLTKWVGFGWERLNAPPSQGAEEPQSLAERMSLVHLLLKVQRETPDYRDYLYGETYAVIPALLMPRMLNPEKPVAHEGSHILSVYYGLQTREATKTSTIAWGPLNEAYANFGTLGVLVVGILIGALYGGIAKMATGVPMLSLRTMIAIVFSAFALQVEWTAGIYVSSLFQALVVMLAMSFVLMERRLLRGRTP